MRIAPRYVNYKFLYGAVHMEVSWPGYAGQLASVRTHLP